MYSGSTGTINIGSAIGDTATRAGIIDAERILFGAGNGSLVFNHTDTDYSFDSAFAGNGTIEHLAGTTLLSADSTAFTCLTTVSGGRLIYDDALLGGTIDVLGTGVFGGNGTAGRAGATNTIGNGGILSPGLASAIGVMNVAGDLVFDAGSTYAVDVSTATSDLTSVSGDVTNGAHLLSPFLIRRQATATTRSIRS